MHKLKKSFYIYSQKDINRVEKSLDLPTIVGMCIPLTQQGAAYLGICPYHEESYKSNNRHFRVNRKHNTWKCFSCGSNGRSAIYFFARFYKISFCDALEFLNNKYSKFNIKPIKNTVYGNKIACRGSAGDELPF